MIPTDSQAATVSLGDSFRTWVQERGALYALLQTPILAIIAGVFYHVVPYPFALIPTLVAFVILPLWIVYRRQVSTNPDEPVHHLHRYAIYALLPSAMFSVSRIPLHYLFGIIYWHPWYDFGNALTQTPLGRPDTLFVGGLLNAIQGWAMGIGFYVLFKRHSLINVLLYITVYVSSLYSFVFATYSRVGLASPPYWHAAMAWAHFWIALTLWFMPQFGNVIWPRLKTGARVAAVGVEALILAAPSIFAQYRAATWELPRESSIDRAAFSHVQLVTVDSFPPPSTAGTDARYFFMLRLGPRGYRNWFKQTRALDSGPVDATGRVWHDDQVVAWCASRVERLATSNHVTVPIDFPAALQRTQFTDIPVMCTGPATAAASLSSEPQVTLQWTARVKLIGGHERQTKQFNGNQSVVMR